MAYYSVNNYIQDTFGRKLYKIAINAGFTCPNRDGSIDTRGCVFCDGGAGDFAMDAKLSVSEQIERGKDLIDGKLPISKQTECGKDLIDGKLSGGACDDLPRYIAYFQAYTNTYASIERLRYLYMEAIHHPDVAAISIATRPDCVDEGVLELLAECNAIKPVWVELGLQTTCAASVAYIRRGYSTDIYDRVVQKLREIGIAQVITHVIIGLPGESLSDMEGTVRHAVAVGTTGIKLQLLHVLAGTDLARDFDEGKFECLSMDAYCDIVVDLLKLIPPEVVVHRITGDGNKKKLIAPLWSGDKKRVLNELKRRMS